MQEVDWSVGEIVRKLTQKGIAEITLIVFTSDNAIYAGMGLLHPFLFDLNVDPNESYDQRSHHPDRARRMRDQLYAFNREIETNPRGWLNGSGFMDLRLRSEEEVHSGWLPASSHYSLSG
ncbi:MAG: sulfatase-like hydrolase/transferase [Anaerolineales bacterium]|nr:sulfatase-like hydrolase/transferase [Anaerolineales bacterium]